MGNLPHWDLSNVYSSLDSQELARDIRAVERQLRQLEKYLDENGIRNGSKPLSAARLRKVVDGYLDRANALIRQFSTIMAYISAFVSTDSFAAQPRKMQSELEPLGVRMSTIDTRFTAWIGQQSAKLDAVSKAPGTAHNHRFYLQQLARQSRYMMSEAEEKLAAELNLSGASAWNKLQGTIVSQLSVNFEHNGVHEAISMPALINIIQHDPDQATRKRAYELELETWKTVEEPLAAAMNGVKGFANTLDRKRGRKQAVEVAIDAARIDRKTLDAMLGAMTDSFPHFRRYMRKKAARLGNSDGLPWWDLMAPIGRSERSYTWEEGRAFIESNFATFSPRLLNMTQRAYDNNWIDAEQRKGKRAGAFCMDVQGVDESRILCNFDGSLDQISTVAHELGHAFHNECQIGQPALQNITPMTLAETASIFCENIIIDAALANAGSSDEELSILETDLIGKNQVIVDITSRYLFETEVFKRREKAELSADDLNDAMLRAQKATYGNGLDERYMHKYMWTWKPHYYYPGLPFYNFPYAFGLLFALGLYAIYRERGQDFVKDYESLLASTGMDDAATLARRFKIDIRKPAFWKGSLDLIAARIDRYCAL
jgi:pepF/M3 family oligoendopeptidase